MKTKPFSIELSDQAEVDFNKSYEFYSEDSPKVADTFFKFLSKLILDSRIKVCCALIVKQFRKPNRFIVCREAEHRRGKVLHAVIEMAETANV